MAAGILCVVIGVLSIQLIRYKRELNRLASQLEETGAGSNLRLGTGLRSRSLLRFLRAINQRLVEGKQAQRESQKAQAELKYTISCVSHDIRTPLTGASGYLQLLEGCEDREKRERYIRIISGKMKTLEEMLGELFLYTKIGNSDYHLNLETVCLYDILCEVMAEFFESFEDKKLEPIFCFTDESMSVIADKGALKRVFMNLTDNALHHGEGNLYIRQLSENIIFENELPKGEHPDAEQIFERFYKEDTARQKNSTGLGLAIVKQLMEKMGGKVETEIRENKIYISLLFCCKN